MKIKIFSIFCHYLWLRGTLRHSFNGVPQGSVLDPFPFFLYTCIDRKVISSHAFLRPRCWWHQLILSIPCPDSHSISRHVWLTSWHVWQLITWNEIPVRLSYWKFPKTSYHTTCQYMKPWWNYHSPHILLDILRLCRVLITNIRWICSFQFLKSMKEPSFLFIHTNL